MPGDLPISVVIVTHDSAGEIQGTLGPLRAQMRPEDELVVVDNASTDGTAALVRELAPDADVVDSRENLGFSAGANLGAARTGAPLLLLLNPDCVVEPGCLDALRACASDRPGWGAWQAAVLLGDGTRVNTAGNVAHFLGLSWAGRLDDPVASLPSAPYPAPFASGAALVVRRAAWVQAGGFDERYFMYCEDLDLGLRLRLLGWEVGVAPAARVIHDYEFAKGSYKWFYLERNRWWTVLGTYPAPMLALVLPALLALELALLPAAALGGWLGAKLRSYAAVARELPAILARRRAIQATRAVPAGSFAASFTAELDSPVLAGAARFPGAQALLRGYWTLVRRLLRSR